MSWILTKSNQAFDFLKPDPDVISMEDIGWALSNTCRFNGQCNRFYSVARHSLNLARYAHVKQMPLEIVRQCFLHDASEAYTGDIVTPLKSLLSDFKKIEDNIQSTIYSKYGLPERTFQEVKNLDLRIMLSEKQYLLPRGGPEWEIEKTAEPLEVFEYSAPDPEIPGRYMNNVFRFDGLQQNVTENVEWTYHQWLVTAATLFPPQGKKS